MKKIYLIILSMAVVVSTNAQLSLTQAFNEPVIGNTQTQMEYDSTGVLPRNTGVNQLWDFSACSTTTITDVTSFISAGSSGPNSGIYTGATMADFDGGSFYNYYKSTSNQIESLGFEDVNIVLQFTNTAIMAVWPITMGTSISDVAAGTCTALVLANALGTVNGTSNVSGTGTGTLIVPGGGVFTNILQTVSTASINIFCPSTIVGPFTLNNEGITYTYYHASQKFPILTIEYVTVTGNFPSQTATIKLDNSILTGINDVNFDALFSIYPNPAKNNVFVKLHNETNANCGIEIINAIGQITKSIDLGRDTEISNNISISNLTAGIYILKTTLGNKVSTRKLIVE